MDWESASATHPGRIRQNNEDSLLVREDLGLFAVADGMGGHAAGEVASRLAIDALVACSGPKPDAADLAHAFERANRAILERAGEDSATRGMGTTLSALAVDGSGHGLVAHIGDSRLYRCRDGRTEQLTRDHSWVQEHMDAGVLTADQAKNHPFASVLTRVLGTPGPTEPDIDRITVQPGDLFLLCSDGLTGMIGDDTIDAILATGSMLDAKAADLIDAANQAGGADNVTVVLVRALLGR